MTTTLYSAGHHDATVAKRPRTLAAAKRLARTAPDANQRTYWNGYVAGLNHRTTTEETP